MRQLARTLLILGSVTACERAHPDSEPTKAKPAPLVDPRGAPAVGNIGQTGAPEVVDVRTVQRPSRRAQRVVRAATMPRPGASGLDTGGSHPDPLQRPHPDVDLTRPELPPRVPPSRTTRLDFQREDSAKFQLSHERPLVNRRERPAHANMGRRAHIEESE